MNEAKKITVQEEIFLHLPSDVKLDALILRKLGRLEIVPSAQAPGARSS
jgi:hypothetical protein